VVGFTTRSRRKVPGNEKTCKMEVAVAVVVVVMIKWHGS
jgi:hypothetical protein